MLANCCTPPLLAFSNDNNTQSTAHFAQGQDLSPSGKVAEKKRSAILFGTRAMLYCLYIKMWPMFSTHIFPTSSRRDSRLPCLLVSARTLSPAGWVERATSRLDKPLYGITRHSSCGPPIKNPSQKTTYTYIASTFSLLSLLGVVSAGKQNSEKPGNWCSPSTSPT